MRTKLYALVAAAALLAGCVLEPGSPASRLADAMNRWERAGIRDYEITVSLSCFCGYAGQAVLVRVENGTLVSRTFVETGEPVPALLAERYPDVPGLFVQVQKAYAEADDVAVRFDPELGFPTSIEVDWHRNAIDDESQWISGDLRRL